MQANHIIKKHLIIPFFLLLFASCDIRHLQFEYCIANRSQDTIFTTSLRVMVSCPLNSHIGCGRDMKNTVYSRQVPSKSTKIMDLFLPQRGTPPTLRHSSPHCQNLLYLLYLQTKKNPFSACLECSKFPIKKVQDLEAFWSENWAFRAVLTVRRPKENGAERPKTAQKGWFCAIFSAFFCDFLPSTTQF